MKVTFERQALYEAVWSTPLTTLGKQHGLSDNGLRKVCKALNIPLPKAGHWAKVAAGQTPPRTTLPNEAPRQTFTSHPPAGDANPHADPRDEQWLADRRAFEADPAHAIAFNPAPTHWHAAIRPIRQKLLDDLREIEAGRKREEALRNRPRGGPPAISNTWKWHAFERSGGMIWDTHKKCPIRVTPQTHERALAILNAVCVAVPVRGFKASYQENEGRLLLDGHGAQIHLRISAMCWSGSMYAHARYRPRSLLP